MAFNLKLFLLNLAALAPTIVAGTAALAGEASTVTKTQLATDSANLATGVAQALTAGNEQDQAIAAAASQITQSVITATSLAHAATGLPTLHSPAVNDPAPQPATIGQAKQIG